MLHSNQSWHIIKWAWFKILLTLQAEFLVIHQPLFLQILPTQLQRTGLYLPTRYCKGMNLHEVEIFALFVNHVSSEKLHKS